MKITIENKDVWRIDFDVEEMRILKNLSDTTGIPLYTFGGLSPDSPWIRIRAEHAVSMINKNVSLTRLYEISGIDKYVNILKKSPSAVTVKVRKNLIEAIRQYIPKGFFIAK